MGEQAWDRFFKKKKKCTLITYKNEELMNVSQETAM